MSTLAIENVRILMVDDEADMLQVTQDWFATFGYSPMITAGNTREARQILDEHHFDVIIADMRMEEDDSGFGVIEEVQARNLTSVVIIFTANETWEDCRRAFRYRGCWDYLSKTMDAHPWQELDRSIREAIAYFNHWGNRADEAWLDAHQAELLRHYRDQYVAVMNQRVLDAAQTKAELQQRIAERKLPGFLPVIRRIADDFPHDKAIADLVKQTENHFLEFKSTLLWDINEKHVNTDLVFVVLKTIAAFMNTEGGTLLIGVTDTGEIYGLESDYRLLKKPNDDGFELRLRDEMDKKLGAAFSGLVNFRFKVLDNKTVCAVEISKSSQGVFLQQTKKADKAFYVRTGNRTIALNVEGMYQYLRRRMQQPV